MSLLNTTKKMRIRFNDVFYNCNKRVEELGHFIDSYSPRSNLKMLEIGCGGGDVTSKFRDQGFDCHGIDVEFKEGDKIESLINLGYVKKIGDTNLNRQTISTNPDYKFPHDDETFNFAFSESTIEHVENINEYVSENSRILKKDAYCIHYFPSKFSIIEPHIGIPLGGIIHNKFYYFVMIKLGLSFPRYRHSNGHKECYDFIKFATFYRTKKEIINVFKEYSLAFICQCPESVIEIKAHNGSKLAKIIMSSKVLIKLFAIIRSNVYIFRKV